MIANKFELAWAERRGSFKGVKCKGMDIDHIYNSHHPYGTAAKHKECQKTMFPESMSKKGLISCIARGWKNRIKLKTRRRKYGENSRVHYKGFDEVTGIMMVICFNMDTQIIETAYPIHPNKAKYYY